MRRNDSAMVESMIAGFIGKMGCFPAGTLVQTIEGNKPIQAVDSVLSYDFSGRIVSMPCFVVETRKDAYELLLSDGSRVVASGEHCFYTGRGVLSLRELLVNDYLYCFEGEETNKQQEPLVNGVRWSQEESDRIIIECDTQQQVGVLLMPKEEYEQQLRLSCVSQGLQQQEQLTRQLGCFVPIVSLQSPLLKKQVSRITRLTHEPITMYDVVVPCTNNLLLANGLMVHNSGKTLSMVRETLKYHNQGYKIYSNFHLTIPYEPLNFDDLFRMAEAQESLSNVVILLDEVHILLDSRSGMRKENKLVTFWLNQTRKMGVKLYYTTQHMHQIDKRLRSGTDFFVFCEGIKYKAGDKKEWFICVNTITDGDNLKEERFVANKFFKYYDTNQVISFLHTGKEAKKVK